MTNSLAIDSVAAEQLVYQIVLMKLHSRRHSEQAAIVLLSVVYVSN